MRMEARMVKLSRKGWSLAAVAYTLA
jgi:hypothetical protein